VKKFPPLQFPTDRLRAMASERFHNVSNKQVVKHSHYE
jgi:hypothetical protein